jgi:putative hydrolase of the HAD superfamily
MRREIAAAAFDVDGTLYPDWRLYLRAWPAALFHPRLFAAFSRARARARRAAPAENRFYDLQAMLCAEELGPASGGAEYVKTLINKYIYSSLEKRFDGIEPYPHVTECLHALKERGLKIAVLSDFPLGRKLEFLRLDGIWDAALCSEEEGALKPHPLPFLRLAESLKLPPERILYVGNNPAYDIAGAKNAGMMTALRCLFPRIPPRRGPAAGFAFNDYRHLQSYVLK